MSNKSLRITSEALNPLYRMSVGFDRFVEDFFNDPVFTHGSGSPTGYPPFNINKIVNTTTTETEYEVVLALAGFTENDIEICVENNNLKIMGTSGCLNTLDNNSDEDIHYLHKGIAERSFNRTFKLADYVEVKKATLKDGILRIRLWRDVPEAAKPKKIAVTSQ